MTYDKIPEWDFYVVSIETIYNYIKLYILVIL